jgi:hypothetical protein
LRKGAWLPGQEACGALCDDIAPVGSGRPPTVRRTIGRIEASLLTWPLLDYVTNAVLEAPAVFRSGSNCRQIVCPTGFS